MRPVRRSSLHTPMPRSAARIGSAGATETVHSAASDRRAPSAASRLNANCAAAAAQKPATAIAVVWKLRATPSVRLQVTRTGLMPRLPSGPLRRAA